MKKVLRCKARLLQALVAIFLFGLAVVGFLYWRENSYVPPFARTHAGIFLEQLIPQEATFAVSLNPTNAAEKERFRKLWAAVLKDKTQAFLPFLAQEFANGTEKFSNQDAIALFGGDLRLAVAIDQLEKGKDAFYYAFKEAADPAAAREILAKLSDGNSVGGGQEGVYYPLVKEKGVYMGLAADVLFLTNSGEDGAAQIVKQSAGRGSSLLKDKSFRKAAAALSQPISGYMFVKTPAGTKKIASLITGFHAEDNGIAAQTISFGLDLSKPYSAYLYKKVPAAGLIMAGEIPELGELILDRVNALDAQIAQTAETAGTETTLLEDFKNSTGFDFNTDILPFMQAGAAMTLHDNGLTVFVDAAAASDKARQVVEKLDKNLPQWAELVNVSLQKPGKEPVMEYKKFNTMPSGLIAEFHFGRIPKDIVSMPIFDLMPEPLQISYGLTPDNILFLSTVPGFENVLKDELTVDKTAKFQELLKLGVSPGSFVIFDAEAFGGFAEKILSSLDKNKNLSPQEKQTLDILKKYLSPIKGFLQVNQGNGTGAEGKAFLEIAP